MGVYAGPEVASNGLVLALDGANFKSFKGEVTTNLIPNPTVNAYPTTGNAWGTYNTNQYGSGTYFSIGTVNDVTNNIITMTSAHSLRTYDVMQPQTTGGGVTAGTNYFIKKISNTSFSLHAYNSSQDGSQGYINPATGTHKVYDSIANDTRISVNSTSFPTMWWGYPHLPNSALVKELRYGEFNAIPNLPANDCIRLHYIRTDDVKDGMSYGVDCTITPSSPVTVSFYTRSANSNAVGKQIQYQIYNYTGGSATGYSYTFTLGPVGVWQRQTYTFTPAYDTMISYWFAVTTTGTYAWDWSCMQVEQKSYVTNFVAGTRGSTVATGGGWADLTGNGNHGTLVNGVKENDSNGGSLIFDGTNDRVTIPNTIPSLSNFTIELFMQTSLLDGSQDIFFDQLNSLRFEILSNKYRIHLGNGSGWAFTDHVGNTTLSPNTWYHTVWTWNGSTSALYLNGVSDGTRTYSAASSGTGSIILGQFSSNDDYNWNGRISNVKIYNRALTAAEVQQNFNASRFRFGL